MTESSLAKVALSRPDPAAQPGPLDDRLYDLVEARFRRLLRDNPTYATYAGIHTEDERLGDGSRDAVLQELADERAHLAAVEALDPKGLSAEASFERELEIHNLRRVIFDTDVHRVWERRSTAMDTVGSALFAVFARDYAPLAERLGSAAARMEAIPAYLAGSRTRAAVPQVRLWQELEIESGHDLPGLFDEIVAAGRTAAIPAAEQSRLERAANVARAAVADYTTWLGGTIPDGVDDWALGRERYDELVALRAFDGLDADAILAIGQEQLARNKAARVAAAREIDPSVDEPTVVGRIKADHPATFADALDAYRDAMFRARQHLIDHDIVTVPPDEHLDVVETPDFLRNVIPFAAYFDPPKFDRDPAGIYVVTSSVNDSPTAMREHNYSSISNTSIHEAYPGHHLQLSVAQPPPVAHPADDRGPRVRRGLGDVLRADDARRGVRHGAELPPQHAHRRDLAGLPDRPRRPDASRRDRRRGGDRLDGRADLVRGAQRPGRGQPLHVHPDLPALLPARPGPAPPAPRRRAAAARRGLQPARLPRPAAAQRQPADQLPAAPPGRERRPGSQAASGGPAALDRAARA